MGCNVNVETVQEILVCSGLEDKQTNIVKISVNKLSSFFTSDMVEVAKEIQTRMNRRPKILEGKGWIKCYLPGQCQN